MKHVLIIASITLLVACASYEPLVPTQRDVDRVANNIPGITLSDLNQGRAIFEKKCHKCHSLNKPFMKTEEEIRAVLPKMAKKAKIDSRLEDLVLNYLLTMNVAQDTK